jgi:hypothetical protein
MKTILYYLTLFVILLVPCVEAYAAPQAINFDSLAAGTNVTNQFSPAVFSSIPDYAMQVIDCSTCGHGSSLPNYIGPIRVNGAPDPSPNSTHDLYVDFTQPVRNLKFFAIGVNNSGVVGKVDIFQNGTFLTTVDIIGDGTYESPDLVDLRAFTDVTRIHVHSITDAAGFGYDDFTFGTGVTSLAFEVIDSPIDNNPNAAGGSRIFPDRQTPGDTVNRRRVRVKAESSLGANATIFFKSFDLDDPSSDATAVDFNGNAANDNRGDRGTPQQTGILSQPNTAGSSSTISATTDVNGVALIELTVTMQPGDNFMVGASDDQSYLNGLVASGTTLRDSGGYILAVTDKAKATPMLTVWRRLHVEVDSMGNVAGNQVTGVVQSARPNNSRNETLLTLNQTLERNRFESGLISITGVGNFRVISNSTGGVTIQGIVQSASVTGRPFILVDDDDFNSNDGANLDGDEAEDVAALAQALSLMQDSDLPAQNIFAAAYIRPTYDGGGTATNDTSNVAFQLNVANIAANVNSQLNLGRNGAGNERDDFWVVYLQIGYQGDLAQDIDSSTEPATGGVTTVLASTDTVTSSAGVPQGGEGSLVFMEASRDGDLTLGLGDDLKVRSAPHEVGHQFGLRGDTSGFGVMSQSGSGEPLRVVDQHLNLLRWRIKSPGQP